MIKALSLLSPDKLLTLSSLHPLLKYFPTLDEETIQMIDSECRNLKFDKELLDVSSFEAFWASVKKIQIGNDPKYNHLYNFIVNHIFILPHSSANVERVFSCVSLNKTKTRNSLKIDTLNGILHTKGLLKAQENCCYNFPVESKMLSKFDVTMYQKDA